MDVKIYTCIRNHWDTSTRTIALETLTVATLNTLIEPFLTPAGQAVQDLVLLAVPRTCLKMLQRNVTKGDVENFLVNLMAPVGVQHAEQFILQLIALAGEAKVDITPTQIVGMCVNFGYPFYPIKKGVNRTEEGITHQYIVASSFTDRAFV